MTKFRHILPFLIVLVALFAATALCAAAAGEYEVRNASNTVVGTYNTLSSAVSAVSGNNFTINVLGDVAEAATVTLNKNYIYTINGNGHTISSSITGNMLTVSSGEVTLCGVTLDRLNTTGNVIGISSTPTVTLDSVIISGGDIQMYISGAANVTVTGASSLGSGCGTRVMHLGNNSRGGTVTLAGGTFTAADVADGGIKASGALLSISGGTFYSSSKSYIIALSDGDFVSPVDISGGTFHVSEPYTYYDNNNNKIVVNTGVLQYTGRGDLGSTYSGRNGVVVSITNGTFTANADANAILYATRTSTNEKGTDGCLGTARPVIAISGGSFSGSHAWLRSYADVEFRISGTPTFENAATDGSLTRGIWLHNASVSGLLDISGGTFSTTGNAYLIHGAGADINISGGDFTHTGTGINMSDGDCVSNVTISGGAFTNTGAYSTINFTAYNKFQKQHKGFVEITGGTFNVNGTGPVLTYTSTEIGTHFSITGGTFTDSDGENLIVASNGVLSPLLITGGTFIGDVGESMTAGPTGSIKPTDGSDNDFVRSFTRFVPGRGSSGIIAGTAEGVTSYTVNAATFSPFCGMQLAVNKGLVVYFYVVLADTMDQESTTLKIVKGNSDWLPLSYSECVTYPDGTPVDPGYKLRRYTYAGIEPKEMGDAILAAVFTGDSPIYYTTYVLRDYCQTLLANDRVSTQTKNLLANLLHYGAAAQLHNNYKTNALVNTVPGVSTYATAFQAITTDSTCFSLINGANGYRLFDLCLSKGPVNRLGVHITAPVRSAVQVTCTIGGNLSYPVLYNEGNGTYVVYTDGLNLNDFNKTVVFTLKDADPNDGIDVLEMSCTCSVLSYIAEWQNVIEITSGSLATIDTTTGNLARAFGAYYQAACRYFDPFVPVLRFVAISDIHFIAAGDTSQNTTIMAAQDYELEQYVTRLQELFTRSYAYAATQSYNKIDAFMLVGDNTDDGTVKQIETLFSIIYGGTDYVSVIDSNQSKLLIVNGNHEFYDTDESSSDGNEHTKTDKRLTDAARGHTDYCLQFHTIINGYHFIGFSPTDNGGRNFGSEVVTWLQRQLEIAAQDDPTGTKPIFVCQHQQVHSTVNGSPSPTSTIGSTEISNNQDNIRQVLAQYPQVVDFAGHSHSVLDDPGSIWQGEFTALSTGTLASTTITPFDGEGGSAYSAGSLPTNTVGGTHNAVHGDAYNEHNEKETAEFTIVELDANNRMRVMYYHLGDNNWLCEPRIINVGDPAKFNWTGDQTLTYTAPRFPEGQELELYSATATTLQFKIPQAYCDCGVRSYRCELYTADDHLVQTITRLSGQFRRPVPEYTLAPFRNLTPNTTYKVKIYPVSNVHTINDCLTLTVTTPEAPIVNGIYQPDVLQVRFSDNGTAVDTVTGETLSVVDPVTGKTLSVYDTPTTVFDTALGRTVGLFDGHSDYQWRSMAGAYELLQSSMTFEAYVMVTQKVATSIDLVSNQQNGGIGFEVKHNDNANEAGNLYFYICVNRNRDDYEDFYTRVGPYPMPLNEYVHIVATYDGKYAKLYVNGVLMCTENCPANFNKQPNDPAKWTPGVIDFPLKITTQYLSVGGDSSMNYRSSSYMTGRIAAVNLYSTALSAEQIAALATQYPQKVLQVQFNADGTATNAVTGETLVKNGTPTTAADATLGRTVGVFNGTGDYQWRAIAGTYGKLQNAMSLETYIKVDQFVSSGWIDLISDQHSGGIGLELKTNNQLYFLFHNGTDYDRVGPYTMPVGEYVHIVATYDGKFARLYANGVLINTQDCPANKNGSNDPDDWTPGVIDFPLAATAQYLSIGGDAALNYQSSNLMTGSIAAVNLYTSALTADQVAALNVYQRALLQVQFNANGTATNTVTGQTLVSHGTPDTATDATVGHTVGVFGGNGDYQWRDLVNTYSQLQNALTLETYIKVDQTVESGWVDLISNQQNGGFGFELKANNKLYFLFYNGTSYDRVGPYTMPVGEYVHLVVTYDGTNCLLYANGTLVASAACTVPIVFPTEPTASYLSIGGDAQANYSSAGYMTGSIAKVTLFATTLTANQVTILYNDRSN